MANENTFHGFVELSKDLFVLLREVSIVALFFLLLFMPATFKVLLGRVGISKVPTPFGDIDVKDTGETVSNLNRGITDSVARLQQIQGKTTDPAKKQELETLTSYLQDLQQQAHASDEQIKTKLASQQARLQQSSPQSVQSSGWLFLGHVDDSKLKWSGEGAKNIDPTVSPALKAGDHFVLRAPAYLYSDAPSGHHLEGKIIGVFPAGTQVTVTAGPEYSHALAGGFFLWVKVSRSQ